MSGNTKYHEEFESQLAEFENKEDAMLLNFGYPDPEVEEEILRNQAMGHPLDSLEPVITRDDVLGMQLAVRQVHVDDSIVQYIVRIVNQTREDDRLKLGVSM